MSRPPLIVGGNIAGYTRTMTTAIALETSRGDLPGCLQKDRRGANALRFARRCDRGTWLSFENRQKLAISVEGDQGLFNQYGVMLVNPQKHPTVKKKLGRIFIEWLISRDGQATIAGCKIGGQQLFFPNASPAS